MDSEIILKIEIISFDRADDYYKNYMKGFDGVVVTTTKHIYKAGIDNQQNCCEDWGYTVNEDKDVSTFVGATLFSVEGDGTFTNFNTNRGTLNFTAYNEHNGYYSHSCILVKDNVIINNNLL